jgi:D-alanine transaminase
VLRLAASQGVKLEERPFSVAEALAAREAFMSAASAFVLPIIEIDGRKIGDGRPGPIARAFRALYIDEARKG